jgi:hypothetical protein
MKNEIIKAENFGLEEKFVRDVDLAFEEKTKEREILSESYKHIIAQDITKEVATEARKLRLKAAERQRIAKENERLRKEAAEREEKERKERESYEAKLKSEREEKQRIEREERMKREKLEAELKAKEDAERESKKAEEARIQAELNKGDSAKVVDLISDFTALKTKYSFDSTKNQKMYTDACILIDKTIAHIKELIK